MLLFANKFEAARGTKIAPCDLALALFLLGFVDLQPHSPLTTAASLHTESRRCEEEARRFSRIRLELLWWPKREVTLISSLRKGLFHDHTWRCVEDEGRPARFSLDSTIHYMSIASKCRSFLWNTDNFPLIQVLDSFAALSSQFDPGTPPWLPAISGLST